MQSTVNQFMEKAFAGMKADIGLQDVFTRRAIESVPFGYGVVEGSEEGVSELPTATGGNKFDGVTLHTHAIEEVSGVRQYLEHDAMSVMRKGRVWVHAETAISIGDAVYCRHTESGTKKPGAFRNDSDSSKAFQITTARWLSETSSTDQLALLQID